MRTITAGLRAAPAALFRDLFTAPDEMSGQPPGAPRAPFGEWLPALLVPLTVLAAVLLAVSTDDYTQLLRLSQPVALLLATVQAVALVAAVFRPLAAWWAMTLATAAVALSATPGFPVGTVPPGFPVWADVALAQMSWVLFLLALRLRPRIAAETVTISVVVGLVCAAAVPGPDHHPALSVLVPVAATTIGAALRGRGRARAALDEQTELTAVERDRRAVLEERTRIARELHDVVAHHMSVISIQAQVAPHLVENPSEELKENLAGIRTSAVDALAELRRVLGALRSGDEGHAPHDARGGGRREDPRHAPQPTLERLDELIGPVRAAGRTVTATVTGEPRPVPPGVGLFAYRIAQEALSNALRHAPGVGPVASSPPSWPTRSGWSPRATPCSPRPSPSASSPSSPGSRAPPAPRSGNGSARSPSARPRCSP